MSVVIDKLVSLELERNFLGGLFKNPNVIYDTQAFLGENDFHNKFHQTIFTVCKNIIFNGEDLSKVIVAQKVKDLSISFKDPISPFDYLDSITIAPMTAKATLNAARELAKLRIRRDIYADSQEVQSNIISPNCSNKTVAEIISDVDSIYNKRINSIATDDEPSDLFQEIEYLINDPASNPKNEVGIKLPFKIYTEMFGHFRPGITAFCGRAKNNKSTLMSNIAIGAAQFNKNLKILYLDTEMKKETMSYRAFAAISQVNPSLLEKGTWVHNKQLSNNVRESWEKVNKLKGNIDHQFVGDKPIEYIGSIIRKWYFSKVGRGNPALIIYDYIKIGGEKLSNHNAEYQELGRKINYLNQTSQDLTVPIISSMQLNRSAIIDQRDDESAISMTDRLSWFCNSLCIIRKKRPDEITEEGVQFGTHKLIPVVTRYQGDNPSLFDYVRTTDARNQIKYVHNFINYEFSNFLFTEKGTLKDIIDSHDLGRPVTDNDQTKEDDGVEF